jgi:hypothetical protein
MATPTPDELIAIELNTYYTNPFGFCHGDLSVDSRGDAGPAAGVQGRGNVYRFCLWRAERRAVARAGICERGPRSILARPRPTATRRTCGRTCGTLAKEWLAYGAIPADDAKLALDLGSPGTHIRTSGQTGAGEQGKHAEARLGSPDDGDALALIFVPPVAPLAPEEPEEQEAVGRFGNGSSGWMR